MSTRAVRLPATKKVSDLSGAGLLGLVTTGMYNNPLSMYREYIQNAADATAGQAFSERARVDIAIDVNERYIRISDNGPGLSHEEALERLLPIGRSDKCLGTDRGFRGVGRLAGLAFARTVSFTTRASGEQSVSRITWHSDRLPELVSTESQLEQAILDCVDVEALPDQDHPRHFFDVEIREVARHSAGLLLNRDAVRDYIGEVCPVPMRTEFPFTDRLEGLFDRGETPITLEVTLEGDSVPIERPYRESIRLSPTKEASFNEFQVVRIPSIDDKCTAALGWVAHSSYLGAIPREHRVRGIRARVGNIQIGDEAVFDDLFVEQRFNRWCVGELHILDSRIIPNTGRDYFQPGPHLRNLENQLKPVLRGISTRCRRESMTRNRAKRNLSSLCNIEDLYALAISGYLAEEDSAKLVQEALREVLTLRERLDDCHYDDITLAKLDDIEDQLKSSSIDADLERFVELTPSEVIAYKKVFGALVRLASSPSFAKDLIEMVFSEASRDGQLESGIALDRKDQHNAQVKIAPDGKGALTSR